MLQMTFLDEPKQMKQQSPYLQMLIELKEAEISSKGGPFYGTSAEIIELQRQKDVKLNIEAARCFSECTIV